MTANRHVLPVVAICTAMALVGCQRIRATILEVDGDDFTVRTKVVIVGDPGQVAKDYCAVRGKQPVLRDTATAATATPARIYHFSCVPK